ncbi:hypothetical protein VCV18_012506 [Metarhizium anisopliae]
MLSSSPDTSINESAASISPLRTQDLNVCVIPMVLASIRVRSGDTICPLTLNSRSHSADIGGTEVRRRLTTGFESIGIA